jgi:hypothetical protein
VSGGTNSCRDHSSTTSKVVAPVSSFVALIAVSLGSGVGSSTVTFTSGAAGAWTLIAGRVTTAGGKVTLIVGGAAAVTAWPSTSRWRSALIHVSSIGDEGDDRARRRRRGTDFPEPSAYGASSSSLSCSGVSPASVRGENASYGRGSAAGITLAGGASGVP